MVADAATLQIAERGCAVVDVPGDFPVGFAAADADDHGWTIPLRLRLSLKKKRNDAGTIPIRQENLPRPSTIGTPIAVDAFVKRLLFLTVTCLLWCRPSAAELRLEVDLSERALRVVEDGNVIDQFQVAIGDSEYPTPQGKFTIRKVIWNPAWVPPDSKWARKKTPKPPGHPDNPMKRVKMFFKEPDYYIHGSDDIDSLGHAESHGCIRMSPEEVTRLAQLVMEHGGKPMPEPWYRRIFRRKETKVVYLKMAVPIEVSG